MNPAPANRPSFQRTATPPTGIDWEQLPSLAHLIARVKPLHRVDEPVWSQTMPVDFDTLSPSDAFVEALPGTMMREVNEPDVFRLFFDL
jgi:hypothetical protein